MPAAWLGLQCRFPQRAPACCTDRLTLQQYISQRIRSVIEGRRQKSTRSRFLSTLCQDEAVCNQLLRSVLLGFRAVTCVVTVWRNVITFDLGVERRGFQAEQFCCSDLATRGSAQCRSDQI